MELQDIEKMDRLIKEREELKAFLLSVSQKGEIRQLKEVLFNSGIGDRLENAVEIPEIIHARIQSAIIEICHDWIKIREEQILKL